jgi:hypothetical protein
MVKIPMDFIDSTLLLLLWLTNLYLLSLDKFNQRNHTNWNLNIYTSNCILILFISILEEWLHESVVFLMDKIMRKFGLSGKKCGAVNFRYNLRYSCDYGVEISKLEERLIYISNHYMFCRLLFMLLSWACHS